MIGAGVWWHRTVAGMLLVLATGCAKLSGSSSSEPPPNPPPDVMRVFYATDRAPVRATTPYFGAERGGLRVGHADVAVLINDRPGGQSTTRPATTRPAQPQGDHWVHDVQEMSAKNLVAEQAGGIGDRAVMIFVHGYNVTPESALATAGQLAFDVGFDGAVIAFVWPSRAALERYASDEESAQWATPHLAELIRHLKNKPDRPVHVVAHSMGSRVACGALQRLACGRDAVKLPKLGQLVLAAPDIDADIFKAQIVDEIRPLVAGITLYASNNDAALRVSQQLHLWTRAGETGDWVPPGETRFQMVDCTGIDLSKSVGNDLIGHSYYSENRVAEDMQSVLGTTTRPRPATPAPGAPYLRLPPPRPRRAWTRG